MGVDEVTAPATAARVFGDRLPLAERFADMLAEHGIERGLIGPRELDRLWDRHLLNSAVIGEHIPDGVGVVDVGSGAGLPGVPLAIARPDLDIVLLEPMARRVDWLNEVVAELGLSATVIRGRAEDGVVRTEVGQHEVVTARAVAPLARLATWCLPLVRTGGSLLALKGSSAAEEIERDKLAVSRAGGGEPVLVRCGEAVLETPTVVVRIPRVAPKPSRRRGRKQ
ncbi:16S rRNA (guanine(527)-N(7))-methyltransferase RsmG [Amycolatopsis suaedae]|uniref:Ribosomal RNA small subunit methyltransferase G n=1 Tax=Amycolatopsis suaedae TaxID=2510978 RepID=A0A4Q7JB21_9PSEU|nr:16S rRNA (guanine(527)-N(7))-methyltransferase RsmG [Amycolatopsis suaedae]RZQ65001.1 16S rRNA (guanine(527)-N(7))-methyltransferase RsmG [Amycolatopsis suaedae]